jgi:methylated-DNA-[protein]-cysteine S-methyltransferase
MSSPISTQLNTAFGTDAADLAALRDRLAVAAERDGLLDVSYRLVDSPVGSLLLAATTEGIVRVAFEQEGHDDVLQTLADDIGPRILQDPRRLDTVAQQLDEYFTGRRRRFNVPVDLRLTNGFRRMVIEKLNDVSYGTTASYAALATLAGKPAAVRAAASACSHNPLPLVIPCHRIVRSDGSIGQYLGGTDAKRLLLAMEAA